MPHWLARIRIVVLACIFTAALIGVFPRSALSANILTKRSKAPAQALYVTNMGTFSVLQGSELTHSGQPRPKVVFGNSADWAGGLAFDGDGNLWGAVIGDPDYRGTSFIFELTPVQLRKLEIPGKKVVPVIVMDGAGGAPLHFDSAGDLWLATPSSYPVELVMYSPDQLVNGTAPPPARHFNFDDSIGNITDFAFDTSGDLWVDTDYSPNWAIQPALSELTPDQLAASGDSIVPHLGLPAAAGKALAFDSSGDLWAATRAGIYMYPPSELTGSGTESVTPAITIGSVPIGQGASFGDPDGLAFDAQGNLWVASATDVGGINLGGVAEIAADQLTSSGSPQPLVVLRASRREANFLDPSLMTFGPPLK